MTMISTIDRNDQGITQSLKVFFAKLLEKGVVDALLLPIGLPNSTAAMPSLITRPDQVDQAIPLGPAFFINAARIVSRLSWKESGRKTAVLLRPCEIRAFIELTKLKQGSRDELVIMGMDCPMALSRPNYDLYMENHSQGDDHWINTVFPIPGKDADGFEFAPACASCQSPFPVNADLSFLFFGADLDQGIPVRADTPRGEEMLDAISLSPGVESDQEPANRAQVIKGLQEDHGAAFKAMSEDISQQTNTIEKLNLFFSSCINCYNCRNVCPVCYCRECVFTTDVFSHEPIQYHQWAGKNGQIKMPSDTLFYHLTRMAHISHACVGCGQCSNACPSNIPLSQLFTSVAAQTQAAFDYVPGQDDPPPFSVFHEDEFQEIVGIE